MAKQVQGETSTAPLETPISPEAVVPTGGISARDLGIVDGIGSPNLPRLEPRAPAFFLFHPERWAILEGEVVPLLGRLPIIAGVGNVRIVDHRTGRLSTTQAETEKIKRGWVKIPLDVDGPGTSYLNSPMPGVYLTRWDTAHAGSSHVSFDNKTYVRWLLALIARGVLPGPPPYILEKLRRKLVRQISELADKVRTVPSAQVDLDSRAVDLKAVERELGKLQLSPLPARSTGLDGILTE
jgi:hypothetical protein